MNIKKVYSPDTGCDIAQRNNRNLIPVAALILPLIAAFVVIYGFSMELMLESSNEFYDPTLAYILLPIALAVFLVIVYVDIRCIRKFKKISNAMRTAVVVDGDNITIMECAKRQKGKYETFIGSYMIDASDGFNNKDMLGVHTLRKGAVENYKSMSVALDQVQDEDYILNRYENRGDDFRYKQYKNPQLAEITDSKLKFVAEAQTSSGTRNVKFTLPRIFPKLEEQTKISYKAG